MHSQETKDKISAALKGKHTKTYYCQFCGRVRSNRKAHYCCKECVKMGRVVPTLIKYFGYNPEYIGSIDAITEYERIREKLRSQYWDEALTGRELAERYNYPSYCNITGKIFKHLDIPTRDCKETNKMAVLMGKISPVSNPVYMHGWHTTWNGKEVYYRSSYELEYAKYLDDSHIDYDMECLRIKYFDSNRKEFRCAIPDFFLPEQNTIVEVKSEYTLDRDLMKDKISAYTALGYSFKLILDGKEAEI